MINIMTPLTNVDSTPMYALRTRGFDKSGNEYIYLKGVVSTVQYSTVVYDEAGLTVLTDANGTAPANDGPVAIAMGAFVANKYGWYMICGNTYAIIETSISDNGQLYITDTTGQPDGADGGAGMAIIGAWARAAVTVAGAAGAVHIHYPTVHNDAID